MKEADNKTELKKDSKKKTLWARWMDKLDQSMVEKANQSSCCSQESKDSKCC